MVLLQVPFAPAYNITLIQIFSVLQQPASLSPGFGRIEKSNHGRRGAPLSPGM